MSRSVFARHTIRSGRSWKGCSASLGVLMLGLAALELWWAVARVDCAGFVAVAVVWTLFKPLASFLVWSRVWNSGETRPSRSRLTLPQATARASFSSALTPRFFSCI